MGRMAFEAGRKKGGCAVGWFYSCDLSPVRGEEGRGVAVIVVVVVGWWW